MNCIANSTVVNMKKYLKEVKSICSASAASVLTEAELIQMANHILLLREIQET